MKNNRTFKSLPTYGEIESGLFHKPAVIKSVCDHSHWNEIWTKGKAWKQCLKCGKRWKQTVL